MTKIEPVKREVIEGKLLAALDDKDKVAIVASEDDCRILLMALDVGTLRRWSDEDTQKRIQMADDLRKLMQVSFGE